MINDVKLPYYVYVCTGTQTCLLYQVFIPQANSWAIYITVQLLLKVYLFYVYYFMFLLVFLFMQCVNMHGLL